MKRFLILKLGCTYPSLIHTCGDFDVWIGARLGVPPERVAVVNGCREPLPDPRAFAGIVLTGAHVMVTDHLPWSETAARWLVQAVEQEVPVLGICYGHQLLAYAMGGKIGPNPKGREFGTVEITLHASAQTDALLAGMPGRFFGNASHTQSVLRLPQGATCLASSRQEGCHAFAVGQTAWGVQFHPEFDANVVRAYIDQSSHLLVAEDISPQRLLDEVRETPEASAVLRRFAQIADGTGT